MKNNIKDNWELLRLGEIGEVFSGSTPKTSVESYWNGDINWVTPAEIDEKSKYIVESERKITLEGFKGANLKILPIGTVLLTSRAPIGKVAIAGKELCTNQGFKNIVCSSKINCDFLYYFLKSKKLFLNNLGRGATFKEISKKIVEDIQVPLPLMKTQNQITRALDKAQELIDKRKEQIKLLDKFIQSVFIDMFGDPINNNKGWQQEKFLYGIENIKYGTSSPPIFSEEGIPFVRATNIKKGRIIDNEMLYISDKEAKKIEKCKLEEGDLIIVRSGANTGDNTYISSKYQGSYAGYDIIVKLTNSLNPIYVNALFNSAYKEVIIKPLTRRAGQPHLNAQQIKDFIIMYPLIDLQNKFADIVQKVEQQKEIMQQSITEMENNYYSLMQRAFRGELFK